MMRNRLKRGFLGAVAASLLVLGMAVPGQAATQQETTNYYYFKWNGYTFKIPYKVQQTKVEVSTNTSTNTESVSSETPTTTEQEQQVEVPSQVQQVVDLVNAERQKAGLAALKVNVKLADMSKVKAEDMRDHNYFSHTSPTYGSPFNMMKQFGISYSYAGENIAAGQKTAEEVMKAWMNSAGHRANILSPNFTEIGVGFAQGGTYGTYWVQEFIKP